MAFLLCLWDCPVAGEHKCIITMPCEKCFKRIPFQSVRGHIAGEAADPLGGVKGHGRRLI